MLSKKLTFSCDWDNEQFVLGDFKFSLQDIKFNQTLKNIVKTNLEHSDFAVLKLSYPEIYNVLFSIQQVVVDLDTNDPALLKKQVENMNYVLSECPACKAYIGKLGI